MVALSCGTIPSSLKGTRFDSPERRLLPVCSNASSLPYSPGTTGNARESAVAAHTGSRCYLAVRNHVPANPRAGGHWLLPSISGRAAGRQGARRGRCKERLLKLWEGLGYYSRARNLQKAAKVMVERYGGKLPETFEALCSLPGVGVYTAGAIGSIAFGLRVPCVDGNVLRVITRVTDDQRMIDRGNTRSDITAKVSAILPQDRPGDFNQALMELGATVCLPNGEPLCSKCPLATLCEGNLHGTAESLPRKSPKSSAGWRNAPSYCSIAGGAWHCASGRRRVCWPICGNFPRYPERLSPGEADAVLHSLGLHASKLTKGPGAKQIFFPCRVAYDQPGGRGRLRRRPAGFSRLGGCGASVGRNRRCLGLQGLQAACTEKTLRAARKKGGMT